VENKEEGVSILLSSFTLVISSFRIPPVCWQPIPLRQKTKSGPATMRKMLWPDAPIGFLLAAEDGLFAKVGKDGIIREIGAPGDVT
jgi:hypothetical protein